MSSAGSLGPLLHVKNGQPFRLNLWHLQSAAPSLKSVGSSRHQQGWIREFLQKTRSPQFAQTYGCGKTRGHIISKSRPLRLVVDSFVSGVTARTNLSVWKSVFRHVCECLFGQGACLTCLLVGGVNWVFPVFTFDSWLKVKRAEKARRRQDNCTSLCVGTDDHAIEKQTLPPTRNLTLVGERSPTPILYPEREGLRDNRLALLFSAVLLWAKK